MASHPPVLQRLSLTVFGLLSAATVVWPRAAQAIDFNFFFTNSSFYAIIINGDGTFSVDYPFEGYVTGLENNLAGQYPASVVMTKAANDPLAVGTYLFSEGDGFTVAEGQVVNSSWIGQLDSADHYRRLVFSKSEWWNDLWANLEKTPPALPHPTPSFPPTGVWEDDQGVTHVSICACITTTVIDYNSGGSPVLFVQSSSSPTSLTVPTIRSTPGPLPILGAAAFYRSSRQLRRRLQIGSKLTN